MNNNNKVFPNRVFFSSKYYKKARVNESKVLKKKELMYKIMTNPELQIKKIISNKIFEKFGDIKNILIIGNGPIKNNIFNDIHKYDIIVRFNNYKKDNPTNLVGLKTDIHFTCLPDSINIYESWLSKTTKIIIPIEVLNQQRYMFLKNLNIKNLYIPSQKYINILYSEKTDFTRGFYALSIMLQIKENYFPNSNISIIGFGGSGHHFNKNNNMYHGHINELEVIKYLKKKGLITDLND